MKQCGVEIPAYDFAGKTAVVTGGGSGIGFASAVILAAGGANVVLAGVPEEQLRQAAARIREAGYGCTAVPTDVSDEASVQNMVSKTVEIYGGLDILICCAGIGGEVLPLLEQTAEMFDRVVNVNLRGTFLCAKAAAAQMARQGRGGRIVTTSSIAYIEGGGLHGPYGAAKGGVCTLTRSMAAEWAEYGINVNTVCPGLTRTNINREIQDDDALYDAFTAKIPLRRMAEPGEIAAALTFFASPGASFCTGSVLVCDGGATVGGL